MSEVDPITLEVIKNALASVADEMALVVMRSAYSPVVRDTMDYSTALCDRNGDVVAQGLTLAVQLGTFPTIMAHVRDRFDMDMSPGDLFIANDPYGSGGQHLPDIYLIEPIFCDGELEGYAATMAHHADVGGIAPGSIAVHATEIFQEGLRIPLIKLYESGRENTSVFSIIEKSSRQPVEIIGDLRAQIAACRAGARGLTELVDRYGATSLRTYMGELQTLSERLMRSVISELPDGEYSFTDWIDGVGDDPEPLAIAVRVEIAGDEAIVDLHGTAPQVSAALNCAAGLVFAGVYCAFRGIAGRDIPNAAGYMRPIAIKAPVGTIVNPVLPAACGARGVVGYRVYDAVMGALTQIVPDRVVAPGEGGPSLVVIGGYDKGTAFVLAEVMVGCWGARASQDGLEGVSNPLANLSNQPIEILENTLPIRVQSYGFVEDSGGPGTFRGGLAYERTYELLAEEAVLTVRSDRRYHPPYGIGGGGFGTPSRNSIESSDGWREIAPMPMEALHLRQNDVFRHVSAGGGGSGQALKRDPQLVLDDVVDEKVSSAAARAEYGVSVVGGRELEVDETETTMLRAKMMSAAKAGRV